VDTPQFWKLIEDARLQVLDPADGEVIAVQAAALLSAWPREESVAAEQVLSGLMAESYRVALWAAAYLVNGGCSEDGFDYFRGWLIVQGRDVFEHAVADPDTLADLPVIQVAAASATFVECEETLHIAAKAHQATTGEELPHDAYTTHCPELDAELDFDFGDRAEMQRRLPRLTALCWPDV
jgi:hypothetical protein